MEIVLQWLDDFDDFVVSLVMTWERSRFRSLETGLVAALSLPALIFTNVWTPLISTYAFTAGGCVAFWAAGLVGAGFLDLNNVNA